MTPSLALRVDWNDGLLATLFRYQVGDSLSGATFARTSTATYHDVNGVVQTASSGVARDGHYINGTRTLLIEPQRTNSALWSEAFDNASWAKDSGLSGVTADATSAPNGTTTADKLIENTTATAFHGVQQSFSAMSLNTPSSVSVFAKAAERNWLVVTTTDKNNVVRRSYFNLTSGTTGTIDGGHTVTMTALTNGWYRVAVIFTNPASGSTTPSVNFGIAQADTVAQYTGTAGNGLYLWGGQVEVDGRCQSSYIQTTTGAVTRATETLTFPWSGSPQAMTAYVKYMDRGVIRSLNNAGPFGLQPQAGGGPAFLVYSGNSTQLLADHKDSTGFEVTSSPAIADQFGNEIEYRALLYSDGSVQGGYTSNGSAETVGSQSAARALDPNWGSTPQLGLGYNGGFCGIEKVVFVTGLQSMATMRTL